MFKYPSFPTLPSLWLDSHSTNTHQFIHLYQMPTTRHAEATDLNTEASPHPIPGSFVTGLSLEDITWRQWKIARQVKVHILNPISLSLFHQVELLYIDYYGIMNITTIPGMTVLVPLFSWHKQPFSTTTYISSIRKKAYKQGLPLAIRQRTKKTKLVNTK